MLPFIPLHFLCTHFWQLVHCIELLSMPLSDTTWPFCSLLCYLLPSDHLYKAICRQVILFIPLQLDWAQVIQWAMVSDLKEAQVTTNEKLIKRTKFTEQKGAQIVIMPCSNNYSALILKMRPQSNPNLYWDMLLAGLNSASRSLNLQY